MGNDASLETVLSWLRTRYPDAQLSGITSNPGAFSRLYGLPARPISLWQPGKYVGPTRQFHRLRLRVADIGRSYWLAGQADIFMVPGMGVLEDSIPVGPLGLPLSMALLVAFCRLRGRPFLLTAVGAERAQSQITRILFASIVHLASHVSFRDRASAEALNMRGRGTVVPDLAFAHPSDVRPHPRSGLIVVGTMAPHWRGGRRESDRYVVELSSVIQRLLAAQKEVLLVCGDTADRATADAIIDAVRRDAPSTPSDQLRLSTATTFADLSQTLAEAEIVVASRFHNLICALRLGRPAISLGYAVKAAELMRGLGLEDDIMNVRTFKPSEVYRRVMQHSDEEEGLPVSVQRLVSDYKAQVHEFLNGLDEWFLAPRRELRRRGIL